MLQFHRQVACFPINDSECDIPNGVLNAVMYAQSASSIFFDQSFLELLTVFSRMDLISRFNISTCPFAYGWYVSDVRCRTPYLCKTLSTILLQKWVPISIISAREVLNCVNMWLRRNLATTLVTLVHVGIASTYLET